jgi:hypothetical protein
MRRLPAAAIVFVALTSSGLLVAPAVPSPSTSAATTPADRARDYVATVNAGDADAVSRFRVNDTSDAFNKTIPAPAFVQFFRNQHRVTGGLDLVEVRAGKGKPRIVEAVVRDHVYGQLHGIVLTLDDGPDNRVSYFEPADATPPWAIPHRGSPPPSEVADRARDTVRRGCSAGVFSGAALVAQGGRILMQQACGEANLRYHAMNNVDTRFNLGSMNKMFTAVAIMQLIEAGKASLSDTLSKYADDTWLPTAVSSRITIEQLLTHTSGLGSFFDDGFDNTSRDLYRELDDYKPLIKTETLAFLPGSKYLYSDTGMFMLGVIIEKASGENYFDYIRRHIYLPAGMTATDCYPMNEPVKTSPWATATMRRAPFTGVRIPSTMCFVAAPPVVDSRPWATCSGSRRRCRAANWSPPPR